MRIRLPKKDEDALVAIALRARERAYAPYSRFLVGAALRCGDGSVIEGCNVENASYGLCVCAERNAVGSAVAAGRRDFDAIVIATSSEPPSPPCGMCRQVLAEHAADLAIVLVNTKGDRVRTTLKKLFPGTFTSAQLRSGQRAALRTASAGRR
ncbi:MAG: cytidine deaminase [Deltaproteobacteria bacterium]|nr:cytidine deaminase [Deltaproteobacteria bacterium]